MPYVRNPDGTRTTLNPGSYVDARTPNDIWAEWHTKNDKAEWRFWGTVALVLFTIATTLALSVRYAAADHIPVGKAGLIEQVMACDEKDQALAIAEAHRDHGYSAAEDVARLLHQETNARGEPACGVMQNKVIMLAPALFAAVLATPNGIREVAVHPFVVVDGDEVATWPDGEPGTGFAVYVTALSGTDA